MRNPELENTSIVKTSKNEGNSRRDFLKKATAATATFASLNLYSFASDSTDRGNAPEEEIPWYKRVTRWGLINLTEKDSASYDVEWWRKYWKKVELQGIIINGGGILAHYPSHVPLHLHSKFLGDRDLFGDFCRAAHEDGLAVSVRMDSNRTQEAVYKAHPDWVSIDSDGNPYKAGDLYITCINGGYYKQQIPEILTEIAKTYHPEGFNDNSWSGLGRDSICYCENCKNSFRDKTGNRIPRVKNWEDQVYRQWIRWNYDCRLEVWDLNNRATIAAGGPNCIWQGNNSGSISGQARTFRDFKEICRRSEIIHLDHQARNDETGFQNNAYIGKLIHGLLGWNKVIAAATSVYQAGTPTFRVSSKPAPEAQMWMYEAMAGNMQPRVTMISSYHEDRRMYATAIPVFRWWKANEDFLFNRTPIATIGVVWSQENYDFYGRDEANVLVDLPMHGIIQTLVRARIPYLPVHADHIDREAESLSLLVLPNLGLMTDNQIASVRRFVEGGGGLIATGESSLYNEWGVRRSDFALGDLFCAHKTEQSQADLKWINVNPVGFDRKEQTQAKSRATLREWANLTYHTYLRLTPELRRDIDGPHDGTEPMVSGERHPVLKGFNETDILPFGGLLESVRTDPKAEVLMTFIPQFPIYPPETSYMTEPKTDTPGLILNTRSNGSRIAYLPADIDRQFARYNLPDHGNLIENIIRWTSKGDIPLSIDGAGLIDCNIYHQPNRLILHLTNLISAGTWRAPVSEYIPIGPISVRVKLTNDVKGEYVNLLVAGQKILAVVRDGWCHFQVNSILDHEVILIT